MTGMLLELDDVGVTFHTPKGPVYAVSGMSLRLEEGQALGIVGESGSGKSVTMKSIMGLLPRTAQIDGRATFRGIDVFNLPTDRRKHFYGVDVAMVFQNPMTSLNPVKRIGTQLTEGMRYHLGRSRAAAEIAALELLELVRMPDPKKRLRQYPHELSGGMRQRVVIAMALACDPKLLIADEPTTALDVTVQRDILDLLDTLRRDRDMALILISHDLGVVKDRTDNIAVMYGGRMMENADTGDVFAHTIHPYTAALQSAIPDMSTPRGERLSTIPGAPPDLSIAPTGCPFTPRCSYAQDQCASEIPLLKSVPGMFGESGHAHLYSCHFPLGAIKRVGPPEIE